MAETLIVINPYAGAGYASQIWQSIQHDVESAFGQCEVALTESAQSVTEAVAKATDAGIQRVLSIGGDGTNHVVINAIMQSQIQNPDHTFVYGMIPAGTGRDWARGAGMPLSPTDAVSYLARQSPRPIDLGMAIYDETQEYFLNISSAGISNDIVQRVENANKRRPWTFLKALISGILRYEPEPVSITVDGQAWYEGRIYVVAVANGTTFAQGLMIAPNAKIDDALFDVVVIDDLSRVELLLALRTAFNGTHLSNPHVHCIQGKTIHVESDGRALGMDLDGEPAFGRNITYTIQPQALMALI